MCTALRTFPELDGKGNFNINQYIQFIMGFIKRRIEKVIEKRIHNRLFLRYIFNRKDILIFNKDSIETRIDRLPEVEAMSETYNNYEKKKNV